MEHFESVWRVPDDLPAFAGHFPGQPIVPGVVLLDRALLLAQAAQGPEARHGGGWQVSQVKFLSPCGPGDELVFELRAGLRAGCAFTVRCGDRAVASGLLLRESS
ncbi:MAG: 3-hydroxyacyl-ACP dehydratase [Burkholderiaceae bacterium]